MICVGNHRSLIVNENSSKDEAKERIQNSLEFKKGNGLEFIRTKMSKEKETETGRSYLRSLLIGKKPYFPKHRRCRIQELQDCLVQAST